MIDKKVFSQIEQDLTGQKDEWDIGFNDLNVLLKNNEKSSLITVGGRPAMGKTSFITTIMLHLLKNNKKCLFFSLDMSVQQLVKKLIAQVAEVDMQHINSGKTNGKEWERLTVAIEKLKNYDVGISDLPCISVDKIKEKVEIEKPEFVFIDYLQLIDIPSKMQRGEGIENIMKKLKETAKGNSCTIFITSQLSRALETRVNKRPMLSDLRESGAIENVSDVVMFIYRDEYYNNYDDENYFINKGKAEITVAKNKFGPVGTCTLLFRSQITKFFEPISNYEF